MIDFNPHEINWVFILTLKEFRAYLSINEKSEASLLNKTCRIKLTPILFKSINLRLNTIKYNAFNNYSSKVVSSLDQIVLNFEANCSKIKSYVNHLTIDTFFNIYKLPPIHLIFPNLTSIKIMKNSIHLSAIAISFEKLENLKALELENITILNFQSSNGTADMLKLPDSLITLKLKECYIINNSMTNDPYKGAYNYSDEAISKKCFDMMDHYFPNIISYSISGYNSSRNQRLINFVYRNPTLKTMTLTKCTLDPRILDFINEKSSKVNFVIDIS
ncbi:hypothetical protein CONCODRAFT_11320 [Conidiobolus coronatus NRRL 28638]|uniref:RNI-like protein n=1 Tax=Conidiobolus coronatus (strain ATCC 28846 / CBS 209.66 / NRRL 28638) TaxID=796925 RepID=A0A137NVE1_CONC2|nr:hypothetical protein CONCODRAFT_11320 [Conidiobolus coronatus NRRL 28638]|eukprot:KXN66756.1 hypothetical protein CONCODRAFT_11320 [Conidiobolus coronatus NRRL 28638]